MKFNLKNRPKVRSEDLPEDLLVIFAFAMEEWFEGFEKELREMYDKHEFKGRAGACFCELIKEILGE